MTALLIAILSTLGPVVSEASAEPIDATPPDVMSVVMVPRVIDGQSMRARCDWMGGRLFGRICIDVDY